MNKSRRFFLTGGVALASVGAGAAVRRMMYGRRAPPPVPNVISFASATGVALGSTQTSSTQTIAGLPTGASITYSVAGGLAKKNSASFSSAGGTLVNGDTITLQNTASASYSSAVDTTLTYGGLTATFTSRTLADPSIVVAQFQPDPTWDGTPGTSPFGADPTEVHAKPAARMIEAWAQRFDALAGLMIGVDCEAVGGIATVEVGGAGTVMTLTESILTDPDVNGVNRSRIGYWLNLSTTSAQLAAFPAGKIDLWVRITAKDGTMEQRVIGPYRYYPRASEFSGSPYRIAASGAGGAYTSLLLAQRAAKAANEEAPQFLHVENGVFEMEDSYELNSYTGGRGYGVVMCASGVSVRYVRSTFPFGINQGQAGSYWYQGWPGIEFRGAGVFLDFLNIMYIDVPSGAYFDGLDRWPRCNGCLISDSRDTYKNWDWNGTNRPVVSIFASQSMIEDCTIKYIGSPLGGTWIARDNKVLETLGEIAPNCAYAARNYVNGWNPFTFFSVQDVMQLAYDGAGVGRMWVANFATSAAVMHFSVDGIEITTGGFPITLSYFTGGANHEISQVVATINAHGAGWSASALRSDGPSAAFMGGINIGPTTDGGQSPTVVGNSASPSKSRVAFDYHQDFWHAINQTGHGTDNGTILRSNAIIGDTGRPSDDALPRFLALDVPVRNVMVLENQIANAYSQGGPAGTVHLYTRGNDCGTGMQPGADATYSLHEANIDEHYWTSPTGYQAAPLYKDNLIVAYADPVNSARALSGGGNTGNIVISATNAADARAKMNAMFKGAQLGDFRPDGTALANLVARSTTRDAFGAVRPATDARGALSTASSVPTWPF